MNKQDDTTLEHATIGKRFALRMIGVGLLLLTPDRVRNLVRYFGYYWNLGVWLTNTHIGAARAAVRDAMAEEIVQQRLRADRAERILAALREPSETIVAASTSAWHLKNQRVVWAMEDAIRAAVAAAEKEGTP